MENDKKLGLIKKLYEVQKEVTYIQKLGENKSQGYKFARESDVVSTCRAAFLKHGIIATTDVLTSNSERFEIKSEINVKEGYNYIKKEVIRLATRSGVTINFNLIDADTGETMIIGSHGHGADYGVGDKAIYKAISGAVKYACLKALMIETGDDPENDLAEDLELKERERLAKIELDEVNRKISEMPKEIKLKFSEMEMPREKKISLCRDFGWDWRKIAAQLENRNANAAVGQ